MCIFYVEARASSEQAPEAIRVATRRRAVKRAPNYSLPKASFHVRARLYQRVDAIEVAVGCCL